MIEPRGAELISRYKANYHIPDERTVTEEMILKHWELEKGYRRELLASNSDDRWNVFERCYGELYSEISWLNEYTKETALEEGRHLFSYVGTPYGCSAQEDL